MKHITAGRPHMAFEHSRGTHTRRVFCMLLAAVQGISCARNVAFRCLYAQVGYVKGIDLSPGEIAEAKVRYQQVLQKYGAPFPVPEAWHQEAPGAAQFQRGTTCAAVMQHMPGARRLLWLSAGDSALTAEFVATPELGEKEWRETRQYAAVTIMFAIHYFFDSEAALKQLLHNVVINLKPGAGYPMFWIVDGMATTWATRGGGGGRGGRERTGGQKSTCRRSC